MARSVFRNYASVKMRSTQPSCPAVVKRIATIAGTGEAPIPLPSNSLEGCGG